MISFNFRFCRFGQEIGDKGFDYCKDWRISKNKNLEIQFTRWGINELFSLAIDTHFWGEDHAGPEFRIEVLGLYFCIKLYDSRHWNYTRGRFMTAEEVAAENAEWEAEREQRERNSVEVLRFDRETIEGRQSTDADCPTEAVLDDKGNVLIPAGYFKAK